MLTFFSPFPTFTYGPEQRMIFDTETGPDIHKTIEQAKTEVDTKKNPGEVKKYIEDTLKTIDTQGNAALQALLKGKEPLPDLGKGDIPDITRTFETIKKTLEGQVNVQEDHLANQLKGLFKGTLDQIGNVITMAAEDKGENKETTLKNNLEKQQTERLEKAKTYFTEKVFKETISGLKDPEKTKFNEVYNKFFEELKSNKNINIPENPAELAPLILTALPKLDENQKDESKSYEKIQTILKGQMATLGLDYKDIQKYSDMPAEELKEKVKDKGLLGKIMTLVEGFMAMVAGDFERGMALMEGKDKNYMDTQNKLGIKRTIEDAKCKNEEDFRKLIVNPQDYLKTTYETLAKEAEADENAKHSGKMYSNINIMAKQLQTEASKEYATWLTAETGPGKDPAYFMKGINFEGLEHGGNDKIRTNLQEKIKTDFGEDVELSWETKDEGKKATLIAEYSGKTIRFEGGKVMMEKEEVTIEKTDGKVTWKNIFESIKKIITPVAEPKVEPKEGK